jgi:hypothetical protein
MSVLRSKKKSRQDEAVEWLTAFLKLGAVGAAAKGAKKTAAKKAKKAAKKGVARRVVPVAALGTVGVVAVKKLRGGRGTEIPAYDASANGSPTPASPPSPVATQP